jgi:hypothetical protein
VYVDLPTNEVIGIEELHLVVGQVREVLRAKTVEGLDEVLLLEVGLAL